MQPSAFHASLLASAIVFAMPAMAQAVTYDFHIHRQPLVGALNAFSQATGWQVGLPAALADGVDSPGVAGQLPPEQALAQLLAGTGLGYQQLAAQSVVLSSQAAVELPQTTISATRTVQPVDAVPSTVSVLDRQGLDRDNSGTLKALVRYEPGVSVGGTGHRAGLTGYNIRGIDGNRVLTQVDGVTIPSSYFNGPYAQTNRNYVDPEIVKRVEILRGPASALYGSDAIGGAVSYYTLDPSDIIKPGQQVGARLKAGYSSADDSWLKSTTVAGRNGEFDGLLHFSQRSGHETETYGGNHSTGLTRTAANPENADITSVLAKAGWDYNDDGRLGLVYEHYKSDVDTDQKSAYGGPYFGGQGIGAYRWRTGNDTITRERFGITHDRGLNSLLADHAKWSLNYQIGKTDQRTDELYTPAYQVLRHRQTTYKDREWVFDAQFEKALSLGDIDHLLTYGTTLKRQKVTGLRTGTAVCTTVGRGCTAVGAPSPDPRDTLVPTSDFPDPTIDTYSLFAQDRIQWHAWSFLPSVRYDYTHLAPDLTDKFLASIKDPGNTEYSDKTKTWHRLTPKLGITYAFDDHYTGYGQYAEGFRTPTAKALYGRFENLSQGYRVEPNPHLKPERSRSYETGLRGKFDAGHFSVALFYNTYRDFIDENAIAPGYDETTFKSANIKHATIRGAELSGRLNLNHFGTPHGWYTQGSLAYARGRNNDTGAPLNSVNPLTGVLGLGYEQSRYGGLLNWTVVRRKDRIDQTAYHAPDGGGVFNAPGYGVLDLSGFYKVTNDITVNAGVYNLGDKKYWQWDSVRGYDAFGEAAVTAPANLDRLTEPGRNFAVNVVWQI
ncbi:TonB-dependent receptor [Pseudomonas typographi]|uniref:TonB-dependent hemoglobin/transferrin/lactoferrin family receptor n=1 Tax=Pseudomonas typographi TaxID=2715964 RepID=A0ABR7YXG2_9PSED|nr:TonB-dependent hemoglobin/transferrin/lactoferrin family receptor [Pseudomonas typographi]MBD1597869.1 TonB-dependent hemoglobin/transferrin/lactoferrin family receptor [Pseudomonas typographi]